MKYMMDKEKLSCAGGLGTIIRSLVCGIALGIGGILPGVSGSAMAVSFGLYKPIIDALMNILKTPKRSILFLIPIGIGVGVGLLAGVFVLDSIFETYQEEVMYLFLGMVMGGIPAFIKEANSDGFKAKYLIATAIGLLLGSLLLFWETETVEGVEKASLTIGEAIATGAIIASGVVIPGISTAFILLYLGWLTPAMAAVTGFEIRTLFFIALGGAICVVATLKLVSWLISRFHGFAYYGTLGFLLVSCVLVFPGVPEGIKLPLCIVLTAAGFAVSFFLGKLGNKK